MAKFAYTSSGPTTSRFFASDAFVKGLRGPVGSGKTVACCVEVFRHALEQEPNSEGLRQTRWAIIRNTQPELKTTTIKTWLDWFPESTYGKFNWSPPFTHRMKRGEIDCEVIFLALDQPEDVKKLLSLELTGAFVNETREVIKEVIDALTGRVGRFPSKRNGGCTWQGIIMDTNSPDEDHWWGIMAGEQPPPEDMTDEELDNLVKPSNWEFFSQPAAMIEVKDSEGKVLRYDDNPQRENKAGIDDEYYRRMLPGKGKDWINVYILNRYGSLLDGKPVYRSFSQEIHIDKTVEYNPNIDVWGGFDFGLTPSCILAQHFRGQWRVIDELVSRDMGMESFIPHLQRFLVQYGFQVNGENKRFRLYGDPAGDNRAETDEKTVYRILNGAGLKVIPASSNDISLRISAVNGPLTRLVDRKPGLVVHPRCKNIVKGFESGYHYKRLRLSGGTKFDNKPNKNQYSHPHDALQYLMLGGGEGRRLTSSGSGKTRVVKRKWDVFGRKSILGGRKTTLL